MRKLFSLFLALVATTSLWAYGYDFQSGNLYYKIFSETTVQVTYRGYDYDSYDEYSGEVIIPSTVTYYGTTYNVTRIGSSAFRDCSSLTSITIPNSVEYIGEYAFRYCSSLTSVTIGNSVIKIGVLAFDVCSSLVSMVVESGNTRYDSRDNCNAIIETATNILIAGCQNTIIPNSVTTIGSYAFSGCSSLTSVTIPNSVTSIRSCAFCDCSKLTSVTIGNSVTSIGDYAFENCSSLTSVTIPESVTSIGNKAFCWCGSLRDVICEAVEGPALGSNVFSYAWISEATLYVPAQSLDDYKAAYQWKGFGRILPLEEAPSAVENTRLPIANGAKLLRDGQLLILKDNKTYTIMGAEIQ